MKIIEGDLIQLTVDGGFDVIVHGCNCFCTMGAGIAAVIKARFPEAFEADLNTKKGDHDKLGTISSARVKRDGLDLRIVNAYSQYRYSGGGVLVDYEAIRAAFATIAAEFPDSRIGYPLIGAGLAGGDWNVISKIIDAELESLDHTLVKFKP
ncbi:MAG: phosphatase [Pyrinomonadaceae bacterium]|nr:phosphatase [Pyrinomonadaceae bacterium]